MSKAYEETYWIPIEERTPKIGGIVIVMDIDYDVDFMMFGGDHWEDSFREYIDVEDVVAWIPRPLSYTIEGEKDDK